MSIIRDAMAWLHAQGEEARKEYEIREAGRERVLMRLDGTYEPFPDPQTHITLDRLDAVVAFVQCYAHEVVIAYRATGVTVSMHGHPSNPYANTAHCEIKIHPEAEWLHRARWRAADDVADWVRLHPAMFAPNADTFERTFEEVVIKGEDVTTAAAERQGKANYSGAASNKHGLTPAGLTGNILAPRLITDPAIQYRHHVEVRVDAHVDAGEFRISGLNDWRLEADAEVQRLIGEYLDEELGANSMVTIYCGTVAAQD